MSGFSPNVSALQAVVPPYIAGRWYATSLTATSGGAAAAADTVRLYPFQVRATITISNLMARVSTVGLGSFQLAIYGNDATIMRPTGAVLARTAGMLTTSLAPVSADITGADVTLQPGIYWAATNVDATSATAVFQAINANFGFVTGLMGALTEATASSAANACLVTLTTPMAYDTWSTMTGATFTEVANASPAAHIWMKAA